MLKNNKNEYTEDNLYQTRKRKSKIYLERWKETAGPHFGDFQIW